MEKVKKGNQHVDFKKGEVPKSKSEINLEYIRDYCMEDRERAHWFKETAKKYQYEKAAHLKIRKEFVDKYYPEFNEKKARAAKRPKAKTQIEQYLEDIEKVLKDD